MDVLNDETEGKLFEQKYLKELKETEHLKPTETH